MIRETSASLLQTEGQEPGADTADRAPKEPKPLSASAKAKSQISPTSMAKPPQADYRVSEQMITLTGACEQQPIALGRLRIVHAHLVHPRTALNRPRQHARGARCSGRLGCGDARASVKVHWIGR